MSDEIRSEYICMHCGKVMPGGLETVCIHDSICPGKEVILYSGTSSKIIKRKDIPNEDNSN
jgi:DNA-directed RNA polymerase subunit RPC12/RpoP